MIQHVRQLVTIAFSGTPDLTTPDGRSRDRYRRAAWTSLTLVTARICNIATGLLTIPITLTYLGDDLFGIWMTLTSFVAFLGFTDLGLGLGLQNTLIACNGRDDRQTPRVLVANALVVTLAICLSLVCAALLLLPLLPWTRMIKCSSLAASAQVLPTAQAVVIAFAIGLPLGLIQRICDAYQRGYFGYSLLLIGRVLGFLFVIGCVWTRQPLWLLAGGYVAMPFLTMIPGWVVAFWRVPFLRPWPVRIRWESLSSILGIGGLVSVIRLSYAVMNSGPALVIAHVIGAAAVTPFAVTQKLLGVVSIFTMSAMVSLYGAYGEAAQRGEWSWVRRTVNRATLFVTICYVPLMILMVVFGQSLIRRWTNSPSAVPSMSLLLACAVFSCAQAGRSIFANLLQGLNRLTGQAIYGCVLAVISIGLAAAVAAAGGAESVVWTVAVVGCSAQLLLMVIESRMVLRVADSDSHEKAREDKKVVW